MFQVTSHCLRFYCATICSLYCGVARIKAPKHEEALSHSSHLLEFFWFALFIPEH